MMSDKIEIEKGNDYFGRFEPVEVLIWLDGPRTFTLLDQDGLLCMAHWLQEIDNHWYYAVVPITDEILKKLSSGEQSLLDVLHQPRVYLVAVDEQFQVQAVSLVPFEQLPQDALPERGTMLRRDLEPFFRLRSIGVEIKPGDIPAPKGFDGYGSIIDILGDDAMISVDFGSDDQTSVRSCKFSDELWETYGEKFHYQQRVQVFGVISGPKDPITVLEIGFPENIGQTVKTTS
jgi:hypothetical protein